MILAKIFELPRELNYQGFPRDDDSKIRTVAAIVVDCNLNGVLRINNAEMVEVALVFLLLLFTK